MITNKLYGVREAVIALAVAAALLFMGMGFTAAHAQTTSSFTPPTGYVQLGTSGIYYNSATGLYYNPMTGQYSNLQPLGQATMNQGGSYNVPNGYVLYNNTPYYYNSASGYYYDPSTGFYSTTAPTNTGVTITAARSYTAATPSPSPSPSPSGTSGSASGSYTTTPGVPNTGAGGNAATTFTLFAVLGLAVIAGSAALSKRIV